MKADSYRTKSKFNSDITKRLLLIITIIFLSCKVANAGCSLPGDTNNDGVVSITEVQQSINAFLGIDTERTASITEVQQTINAFLGIPQRYTVSGKITGRADGRPFPGATLTLYHATIKIKPVLGGFYGAEVTTGSVAATTVSSADGSYTIGHLLSGSYILQPSLNGYLFNPYNTAVMTFTDSCAIKGNVYLYDPEKTGNTVIDNIIYNSLRPLSGNVFIQDFEGSKPGGV